MEPSSHSILIPPGAPGRSKALLDRTILLRHMRCLRLLSIHIVLGATVSPKIEVSSDLYVTLRTLMEPGDKTPSDVIWRLTQDRHARRTDPPTEGWIIAPSEGLSTGGTVIPNGLRLRMRFRGTDYTHAEVREGKIWVGKKAYDSPSAAANALAEAHGTKGRRRASLNGWRHWEFEIPKGSGRWRKLESLRSPWHIRRRRR